jgi:hypothetical protein
MSDATLSIPTSIKADIWSHLLRQTDEADCPEEAAFGFAKTTRNGENTIFELVEWTPVDVTGFDEQSAFYIELSDEMRAHSIKMAHDLGASLIEFHSHPFQGIAEFSPSDLSGLREFVPHVYWRLKNRPYLAVVVAPSSFDAIAWVDDPHSPIRVLQIIEGEKTIGATGRTLCHGGHSGNQRKI